MMRNKFLYIVIAVVFVLGAVIGVYAPPTQVKAAPNAVVTAVARTIGGGDAKTRPIFWMTGRRLTSDTIVCRDLSDYTAADIQLIIDQGTVTNATTIKMRDTIVSGTDHLQDEFTLVTANTTDINVIQQYPLHAIDTCMFVDLTSGVAVTVTIVAKVMK